MGYNPNTKPVWYFLIPALMGIAVAGAIVTLIVMGAQGLEQYQRDLAEMAGQVVGCTG